MEELKKCPFCGGEAKYEEFNDGFFAWGRVECQCGAMLTTPPVTTIKAWNKRVTEADIRAKAIEEFAEKLKERLKEMQMVELQGEDVCPCRETVEPCHYMNQDISCQYCAREQTIKDVDEIAEKLKGE